MWVSESLVDSVTNRKCIFCGVASRQRRSFPFVFRRLTIYDVQCNDVLSGSPLDD
jgi:hypothetical protein